jgi:hypothetical protein
MVTKDDLAQLRAGRRTPQATLEHTPNGPVTSFVNQNVEAVREKKIAYGEHRLQNALHDMRRDLSLTSRQGLAKAHFNHSKGGLKP